MVSLSGSKSPGPALLIHIPPCQIRVFLFSQALLSHQRLSQSDLLVSFMHLVALPIDIFLSKFEPSCGSVIQTLSYQVRVFWFSQALLSR